MWIRVVLVLVLLAAMGCAQVSHRYRPPMQEPAMYLYTPEGYDLQFWIFEELDGSCVFEYSILGRNKELLGHGRNPCELLMLFFHAIAKRPPTA